MKIDIVNLLREKSRVSPRLYQIDGVRHLVLNRWALIGDEMRLGKSKQVIDAFQVLAELGEVNRCIIVCPNEVRSVWYDQLTGQLAQHLWKGYNNKITEYRPTKRQWKTSGEGATRYYVITNYEFIRNDERLQGLLEVADKKTLLVIDESSCIKSYRAQQTQAVLKIRMRCARVVELNGTPVSNSPGDMFAQSEMMSPSILEVSKPRKDGSIRPMSGYWNFRGRYGVLGGWQNRQVVQWRNLEDLQRRLAPFVIRRLAKDCFDLPERLYENLPVSLTEQTWEVYKSMRDELIVWLGSSVATAAQAGIKVMRLAQITSGFLGGVECERCGSGGCPDCGYTQHRFIGSEKLDFLVSWLGQRFEDDDNFKIVLWTRFRPELDRLMNSLESAWPTGMVRFGRLHGGQNGEERAATKAMLHPLTAQQGRDLVAGTPKTGSMGLNFAAASHEIYVSNERSLMIRQQSEARIAGPEQKNQVWVGDVVASGPRGQKTIDHVIINALKRREDLANLTCSAWIKAISEE